MRYKKCKKCSTRAIERDLCSKHWFQWYHQHHPERKCAVDNCKAVQRIEGYCKKHYHERN